MTEELKPIDVIKYTVTENGNVIRTDNTETLENALARIEELEKENAKAKEIIKGILPYTTLTFDKETNSYLIKCLEQAEDFIKE